MSPSCTLLFLAPFPASRKALIGGRGVRPLHQRGFRVYTHSHDRRGLRPFSTTIFAASTEGTSDVSKGSEWSKQESINEGDIIAIWRGPDKKCDVARVTGGVSSGQTVDIMPLKPFVDELYVDANSGPSYESSSNIRLVRSEYVPSQDGWIVLDVDLQSASEYFALRPADLGRAEVSVKPSKEESRQLSPDALQRQFFRPTRSQAYTAAALSLPLAGILYASYGKIRTAYEASPAGDDLLHGEQFRTLVQFLAAGGAVLTLIVGCGLFLYALNAPVSSVEE